MRPRVFRDLLLELLPSRPGARARFRTRRELATALHVEPHTVSRILNSQDVLDVPGCLRLAQIGGRSYRLVLRLGRKGDVATLIDHLCGGTEALSPDARRLLRTWYALSPEAQSALLVMADALIPLTRL